MVGHVEKAHHGPVNKRKSLVWQYGHHNIERVAFPEDAMRKLMTILATAFLLTPAAGAETYRGYETPAYKVERRIGTAEVRVYAPALVAEVTVRGTRQGAANRGFRILAGYIFGKNDGSARIDMTTPVGQARGEKIAMTTPVAQAGAEGLWTIRFTMPATYTRDTLPKARDPHIRFLDLPERRVLVLQFSGMPGDKVLAEAADRLRGIAAAAGLKPQGAPEYQFYDPPLTLPWNRRNEVLFALP